jgi:hypothetical protein
MTSLYLRVGGAGGIYIDRRYLWVPDLEQDGSPASGSNSVGLSLPSLPITLSLTHPNVRRVFPASSSRPHHKTLSSSKQLRVQTWLGTLDRTRMASLQVDSGSESRIFWVPVLPHAKLTSTSHHSIEDPRNLLAHYTSELLVFSVELRCKLIHICRMRVT